MTRHFLAVSFMALAASASADTVSFQSGEHSDFTRLVATLPSADTQWRLSGNGRTYTIKVDGSDIDFVTDTIFTRIPRTRLQNVVTDPEAGEVKLHLACDCEVKGSWFNDRHVIFDIRAKETAQDSTIPRNFALHLRDIDMGEPFAYSWAQPAPLPVPVPSIAPETEETITTTIPDPTQEFDVYVRNQEKVSRVAQQVIEQINRATEQNLLDASSPEAAEPKPTMAAKPDNNRSEWNVASAREEPVPTPNEPLNVTTYNAVDVAAEEIAAVLAGRRGASECIADDRLDLESWAGEKPFSVELGRLRSELVGEFDLTTSDSMKELAKFYIAHTFGTEAEQILRNIPDNKMDPVLSAMAQLVETGTIAGVNPFQDQGHCASDVAFWAALSGQQLAGKTSVDSALETLAGLPLTLREHLAPYLSNRFVELGHVEAASLVLNAIQRVNPAQGPEFELAQAALHAEMGDDDAAIKKLEKVAAANSTMAPTALVELIAKHVSQDRAVPTETVALVSALAVEHKAGYMGPDLRRAHARARMLDRDFTTAFNVVSEIAKVDGAEAAVAPRSEVTQSLMKKATDFDVLSFAISEGLTEPEAIDSDTAFDLAQKMYDLGFLDQTKRIVQAINIDHVTPELHILKARVALAEDLPRRAEAELMSVEGPEADELRAKARSMSGDHEAAAEILQAMGETERAAFEAWLGGDLSGLSALEVEVYQRIEALVAAPEVSAEIADSPIGILARNRDLLNGSQDARDTLSELLEMHKVSDPAS
ncbi:hypothetical protein BXY66_2754 [Shimia isoporae]|uniref:Tetratricopeptide repeat protein n=1 Tax=Shimia isoporae TaxID=647720 RepID=A0A4R1NBF3_9RHOB|nr:hypothetical protein [Shimia isoporae]TCL01439.1 hypothetical protein BXY66_2754 [Shimia isoporae]